MTRVNRTGPDRSREAARYRSAATDALTLLDWCIEYLGDIHKDRIARRLARNRDRIAALLQSRSRR